MYLQAVNPHPTAISTQLCQFCSGPPCPPSPDFAVHHVPHCCGETGIWSWMRKRHWGCPWPSEQRIWGRPWWCPLNHTTLKQERENMCGIIWLCLLQTFVCRLSMSTSICKTFKQSKTRVRSFLSSCVCQLSMIVQFDFVWSTRYSPVFLSVSLAWIH